MDEEEVPLRGDFEKESDSLIIKHWYSCRLAIQNESRLICTYLVQTNQTEIVKKFDLRGAKVERDPSSETIFFLISADSLTKWIFNYMCGEINEGDSLVPIIEKLRGIASSFIAIPRIPQAKIESNIPLQELIDDSRTIKEPEKDNMESEPEPVSMIPVAVDTPAANSTRSYHIPKPKLYLGLRQYFKPVSYDPIPYPDTVKRPYFPRPWLDDEIKTFTVQSNENSSKPNVFLLQSEKGAGKSTYLQDFSRRAKENKTLLASLFFNPYHGKEELSIKTLTISLLFQFIENVPNTNATICYDRLMKLMKQDHHEHHFQMQNTYQLFMDMIFYPLNMMTLDHLQQQDEKKKEKETKLTQEEEEQEAEDESIKLDKEGATGEPEDTPTMYFIIDGLDDIRSVAWKETLLQFFTFHVFARCPKWVKFIISSDNSLFYPSEIPTWVDSFHPYTIAADDPRYESDNKALIHSVFQSLLPFPNTAEVGKDTKNLEEQAEHDKEERANESLLTLLYEKATYLPAKLKASKKLQEKKGKTTIASSSSSSYRGKYQVVSCSPFLYCSLLTEEFTAIQSTLSLHYTSSSSSSTKSITSTLEAYFHDLPNGIDEAYTRIFSALTESMTKSDPIPVQKAFPLFFQCLVGCYAALSYEMMQSLLQLSSDHFDTLIQRISSYFPVCVPPPLLIPTSAIRWKVGVIDVQPGESVKVKDESESECTEKDNTEEETTERQFPSAKMVTIASTITVIDQEGVTHTSIKGAPANHHHNTAAAAVISTEKLHEQGKLYPLHCTTFFEWFHKHVALYEKRREHAQKVLLSSSKNTSRQSYKERSLRIDWIESILPEHFPGVHQYICETILCAHFHFPSLHTFFDTTSDTGTASPSAPLPLSTTSMKQLREHISQQLSFLPQSPPPSSSTSSTTTQVTTSSQPPSPALQSYLYAYLLDHLDEAGYGYVTYTFLSSFVWLSNMLYLRGIYTLLAEISKRYQDIQWLEGHFSTRKSCKLLYQFIRLLIQSDVSFPIAFTHFHTNSDGFGPFTSTSTAAFAASSSANSLEEGHERSMDTQMYEALCRELALQIIARLTCIINNPGTSIGNNQDSIYQLVKESAAWVDIHGGYLPLGVGTGGAYNANMGWKAPGFRVFTTLVESNHYRTREIHILPCPSTNRANYQPLPSSYRILSFTETFLKHSLIRIWDGVTGETFVLNKYPFLLYTIHVLSDRLLAIGMMDYVRVVNIMTNKLIVSLTPKLSGYAAKFILSYQKDSHGVGHATTSYLVVGFVDELEKQSALIIWNLTTETIVAQCEITGVLTNMTLLPRISAVVFSCDHDKQIYAFSLKIYAILHQRHYEHDVLFRTFCRWDDDSIVIATNHVLTLINLRTMMIRRRINVLQTPGGNYTNTNSSVYISSVRQVTNEIAVAGNTNGEVLLCNMLTGKKRAHWKAHADRVSYLCLLQCHRKDIDWDSDEEDNHLVSRSYEEEGDAQQQEQNTNNSSSNKSKKEEGAAKKVSQRPEEFIVSEQDLRHPSEIRLSIQLDTEDIPHAGLVPPSATTPYPLQPSPSMLGTTATATASGAGAGTVSFKPDPILTEPSFDELSQGLHLLVTCSAADYFLHVWILQDEYLVPTSYVNTNTSLTTSGSTHGASSHGEEEAALTTPMGSVTILQEFSDAQFLTASTSTTRMWSIREHQLHCSHVMKSCRGVSCVLEVNQHYLTPPPPPPLLTSSPKDERIEGGDMLPATTSTKSTTSQKRSRSITSFFTSSSTTSHKTQENTSKPPQSAQAAAVGAQGGAAPMSIPPDYCDVVIGTGRQLGVYNTSTGQCDLKLDEDNIHIAPHSIPSQHSHTNNSTTPAHPFAAAMMSEMLKKKQNHQITAVAQSKGHRIISGCMNGNVHIYNREWYKQWFHATMGDRIECQGHTARITSIVVTREGNMITAAADGTIRIWEKAKNYVCGYKFPCKLYGFGYPTKLVLLYESSAEGGEEDEMTGGAAASGGGGLRSSFGISNKNTSGAATNSTTKKRGSVTTTTPQKKIIAIENFDGRIGLWYYDTSKSTPTTTTGTTTAGTNTGTTTTNTNSAGNVTLSASGNSLKTSHTTPTVAMGGIHPTTSTGSTLTATLSYEMYTLLRKGHVLHHDPVHSLLYLLSYDHSILFVLSIFLPFSSLATTQTEDMSSRSTYQRIDLTPTMIYTLMRTHSFPTNQYLLASKTSTNSNIFSSASQSHEHADVSSFFTSATTYGTTSGTTSSTSGTTSMSSMMSWMRKKGISMMQYPPFSIDEQYVGYFLTRDSQYMIVTGEGGRTLYIVRVIPPKREAAEQHHQQVQEQLHHAHAHPVEHLLDGQNSYGKRIRHEDVPLFTPSKPLY